MSSLKLSISFSTFHSRQNLTKYYKNNPTVTIGSSRQSQRLRHISDSFSISYRFSASEEEEDEGETNKCRFEEAVELFNRREYYECHDYLEALWNIAEEPKRTLIHGILQCAVGFHHLFSQNHRGAMMELGEGLCKLRKMDFKSGPFHEFERDISQVLDFLYQTQIELAACNDDKCVAMDGSERSYKLLGGYAAGQRVYELRNYFVDNNLTTRIVFSPNDYPINDYTPMVKLPELNATAHSLSSLS